MSPTDYLVVLPVLQFRVSRGLVAVERAFAEHRQTMRSKIGVPGQIKIAETDLSVTTVDIADFLLKHPRFLQMTEPSEESHWLLPYPDAQPGAGKASSVCLGPAN